MSNVASHKNLANTPVSLILVGFGRFGQEIYKELLKLEEEGLVRIKKIVNNSGAPSSGALPDLVCSINELEEGVLEEADGVILATPKETHAKLAVKFLKTTNVLIEKPLATTLKDLSLLEKSALSSTNKLMAGHSFRYNPLVDYIKNLVSQTNEYPEIAEGVFLNEVIGSEFIQQPALEMMHFVDVLDYLHPQNFCSSWKDRRETYTDLFIKYNSGLLANFRLGFVRASKKQRWLKLKYSWGSVNIDFLANIVSVQKNNGTIEKEFFPNKPIAIRRQLIAFRKLIQGVDELKVSAANAIRITKLLLQETPRKMHHSRQPKIAIIGAGVFGSHCALELSKFAKVDLFEKNSGILSEASLFNQWRHHSGFHYPLSFETVKEILESKKEFESIYGSAISYSCTSYYCVSSEGTEIPAERFLSACDASGLSYKIVSPPKEIDGSSVSLCVETDEGIYDIPHLRNMIKEKINKSKNINLKLNSEVIDGKINSDGMKSLDYSCQHYLSNDKYDFVVDCSYANWNKIGRSMGLQNHKIRLELVELVELELEMSEKSLTIIDGPFMSLTSMGIGNRYFLSHRDHSLINRSFQDAGDNFEFSNKTNALNVIEDAKRYINVLDRAKYVRSWKAVKAISAYSKEVWERPTVVKNHGYGYWSILGGKILTCVSNSREVANEIKKTLGIEK